MTYYKNNKIILNGVLSYNENAEIELVSSDNGDVVNISKLLDQVYIHNSKYIEFKIMNGCKIIFDEQSNLYKRIDEFGINSYYICGNNLDSNLFNNTGLNLEITLLADAIKGVKDGQNQILCEMFG